MTTAAAPSDQASKMDRMYRYTRHIYDLSRHYYLLGRDHLLRQMQVRPGDHVLEVGCGTARNLIRLHRLQPAAKLYGLDAAQVMLDTADHNLRRAKMPDGAMLRQCLAEELDYQKTFGLDRPFDVIFFSYSLSMIPTWPAALDAALANLNTGGGLYVVDFWDQGGLPRWFAALLKWWLARFHVHHRPEMLDHLRQLAAQGRVTLDLQALYGRYTYIAVMTKR